MVKEESHHRILERWRLNRGCTRGTAEASRWQCGPENAKAWAGAHTAVCGDQRPLVASLPAGSLGDSVASAAPRGCTLGWFPAGADHPRSF